MSAEKRSSDAAIDDLVRQHVDRAVRSVDASQLIARVQVTRERMQDVDPVHRSVVAASQLQTAARWPRAVGYAAVMAVALAFAFLGGRYAGPPAANAANVLRDVHAVHARPVDHCYRVQFAPDPRFWDGQNHLEGPSASVMWTRGDRFWSHCTIGQTQLTLGRQADGTLWISPSPSKALRFASDPAHLPKEVALICAINSMSVPQLVNDVLVDFDLHAEPAGEAADASKTLIWARLKLGRNHPLLSDALLEIDPETNVLSRLVLWMVRDGQPRGTVTYTLLESATRGDEFYRLETHLDADAEVAVQALGRKRDETE